MARVVRHDGGMSFGAATVVTGDAAGSGGGELSWDVPDGWQQGRGAWGGLIAAAVARAVAACDDRPLRSLTLHLSAPVGVGAATLRVQPVRVGSAMSTWQVALESPPGDPAAQAVALTGLPRAQEVHAASASWGTVVPPDLPPWDVVEPIPDGVPGIPTFLQHIDLRAVNGVILGGGQARCAGYVRLRAPESWDAATLLAMVDAWWPAALVTMDKLRPMATVSYAADVLVDPATVDPDVPLMHESFLSGAHDGFTTETRRLWTLDGRLAVENHQTFVIIRSS